MQSRHNKEAVDRMINKMRGLNIISFRVGMSYNRKDVLEELEKKGIINVLIEDFSVTLKRIVINNPTQILKEQMQELAGQFVRAYDV